MQKATKVLLLFLCAMAATVMVTPAAAYPRGGDRRISPPNWGLLPPFIDIDPEARACWAALKRVPSCLDGIFGLFLSRRVDVRLSAECCDATRRRGGGRCFKKLFFHRGPSGAPLSKVVQSLCSSSAAAAPAPQ